MSLVTLSHIGKSFDGPIILDDVTLEIERGRKIGVIGQNGSGKSTMLKIIAGEMEATDGEVFRQRGLKVAYQAQELVPEPGATVMTEMRRVFADDISREERLRDLEHRLADGADGVEQKRLLAEYARLQDEHEMTGGYDVEQRIDAVLSGLGLPREAWEQEIELFSGGERNIISLARILLSDPELILLDEPSNHLDMDGIEWFIRWMRNSPATVVMISHNRHMLDATVQEIWEVSRGNVKTWTGNYSDFQQQKSESLALQERQYKNQQRTIKRLEFQARRLRDMARAYDDPGQAKRAKNLLRRIEQMDVVDKPNDGERQFKARLERGARHGHIALQLPDYSQAFGDRVLFDHAELEISAGERVCLVGPNGSGKTTVFRHILEHGAWENPDVRLGKAVKVGDYNQFHEEVMSGRTSLVDWLQEVTGLLYQPATELLHRFMFTRDDLDRSIGTLSGGEKSRLQLARLVHDEVNFLMLDEPTNHLDIQACETLEQMLEEFDGTLLIISHDRYFLDRLVDVVVEIKDQKLVPFRGTFGRWWEEKHEKRDGSGVALTLHSRKSDGATDKSEQREQREQKKAKERETRKLKNRVKQLEDGIAEAEARIEQLNADLESAYSEGGDAERGPKLVAEIEKTKESIDSMYAEWEQVAAQLESP